MDEKYRPVIPKEHGSWAFPIIPAVIGYFCGMTDSASAGTTAGLVAWLTFFPYLLGVVLLFMALTPVRLVLHPSTPNDSRPRLRFWSLAYLVCGIVLLAVAGLPFSRHILQFILPVYIPGLLATAAIYYFGAQRSAMAEFASPLYFSLVLPAGYYLVTGDTGLPAWGLYLLTNAYFLNRLVFTRALVRAVFRPARPGTGRPGVAKQTEPETPKNPAGAVYAGLFAATCAIAMGWAVSDSMGLGRWVYTVYIPGWLFTASQASPALRLGELKRLGWTEVAISALFTVSLVVLYRV